MRRGTEENQIVRGEGEIDRWQRWAKREQEAWRVKSRPSWAKSSNLKSNGACGNHMSQSVLHGRVRTIRRAGDCSEMGDWCAWLVSEASTYTAVTLTKQPDALVHASPGD